jgi:hypothetical protein
MFIDELKLNAAQYLNISLCDHGTMAQNRTADGRRDSLVPPWGAD